MPHFILGAILAAIVSWYCWRKVGIQGNYETVYGFLMLWTMPIYLIGSLVAYWVW